MRSDKTHSQFVWKNEFNFFSVLSMSKSQIQWDKIPSYSFHLQNSQFYRPDSAELGPKDLNAEITITIG